MVHTHTSWGLIPFHASGLGSIAGIVGLAAAILYGVSGYDLSLHHQLLIAMPLIGLVGLPHGGMDMAVGHCLLRKRWGPSWYVPFTLLYLCAGAVMFMAWLVEPVLALGLFLTVSLFHFGQEDASAHDAGADPMLILAFGAAPFGTALAASPEDVTVLFNALIAHGAGRSDTGLLRIGMLEPEMVQAAGLTLVALVPLALLLRLRHTGLARIVLELTCTMALFLVLPALLAFSVYFSFIHAPRHMIATEHWVRARGMTGRRSLYGLTAGAAIAALTGACLVFLVGQSELGLFESPQQAFTMIIFIGLSVLTAPHVLLKHFTGH